MIFKVSSNPNRSMIQRRNFLLLFEMSETPTWSGETGTQAFFPEFSGRIAYLDRLSMLVASFAGYKLQ